MHPEIQRHPTRQELDSHVQQECRNKARLELTRCLAGLYLSTTIPAPNPIPRKFRTLVALMAEPFVIEGNNVLDVDKVREAGFDSNQAHLLCSWHNQYVERLQALLFAVAAGLPEQMAWDMAGV